MSKIIENYMLQDVIGTGSYGKVYKAKNMNNDSVVAIKVIKLEKYREIPKLHEFTMNEIQTLSKIDNPNIIKFIEMLKTSNNMYLIYEFANGGTLENLINKKKYLSDQEATKVLQQMANGFKTLSKSNILHRDLKPSNILFNDGVLKIADFGFCKALQNADMTSTMVGSPICKLFCFRSSSPPAIPLLYCSLVHARSCSQTYACANTRARHGRFPSTLLDSLSPCKSDDN